MFVALVLLTSCSRSKKADEESVTHALLVNGGFETGALAPWDKYMAVQPTVSSDRAHSGKFSVSESTAKGSIYQDVRGLQPGAQYAVSAWVSSTPGTSATAQIAVWDPGSSVATFSTPITPTAEWKLVTKNVSATSGGILRIHLFRNEGDGTIYWDDVQVAQTPKD